MITVALLALSLALLAYWALSLLPWPAPPVQPRNRSRSETALTALLHRELDRAGLRHIPPLALVLAMALCGGAGAALAWPLQNHLLVLIAVIVLGAAPYQLVRARGRSRSRAIDATVAPALVQIARLSEVRHHPLLALSDTVPMLPPLLKPEFERALAEVQAGLPLPDALRELAHRCGDNFYLHQLAELVAIQIRTGGDLSASLTRLVARQRTMAELRAEEAAELFGYTWLTRILFVAGLLPLPYWAITRSPNLQVFIHEPIARGVLLWAVASGLAIASLPYWLAMDE